MLDQITTRRGRGGRGQNVTPCTRWGWPISDYIFQPHPTKLVNSMKGESNRVQYQVPPRSTILSWTVCATYLIAVNQFCTSSTYNYCLWRYLVHTDFTRGLLDIFYDCWKNKKLATHATRGIQIIFYFFLALDFLL